MADDAVRAALERAREKSRKRAERALQRDRDSRDARAEACADDDRPSVVTANFYLDKRMIQTALGDEAGVTLPPTRERRATSMRPGLPAPIARVLGWFPSHWRPYLLLGFLVMLAAGAWQAGLLGGLVAALIKAFGLP